MGDKRKLAKIERAHIQFHCLKYSSYYDLKHFRTIHGAINQLGHSKYPMKFRTEGAGVDVKSRIFI